MMKRFMKVFMVSLVAIGLAASTSFAANMGKFVAKGGDGKDVKAEEIFKENKSMFIFAQTACSQCKAEILDIGKNLDKFKDKAKLYVVLVDQNQERALEKFKTYNVDLPVIFDPEFALGEAAGIEVTPATVVIDKGGEIKFVKLGYKAGQLMDILEKI